MKFPLLLLVVAALAPVNRIHAQAAAGGTPKTIEFTTDNPDSLVGLTSDQFTLFGLRLGMTQEQAWQVLRSLDKLVAEQDPREPFVLVFKRGPGGVKGKDALFSLSWVDDPQSVVITVTHHCSEFLPANLQRVFKDSVSERPSAFVEQFLGRPSSRKTDKKYQRSGMTVHYANYDAMGVILQRTQTARGVRVSLKLTKAKQPPSVAATPREWSDTSGKFKVRATLVKVADGNATLRKEDGKEITVPVSRLSAADREFLKQPE